ncbi:hypothetical protein [Variovorax sp. KK3]|uniref:hypothetical protein n=1 Tax=Variovorax sp. KK3 TaxID=1855728 RepID=UPI00097CA1DD|nr:hypothetical protein [Variovorax sp. KK3]
MTTLRFAAITGALAAAALLGACTTTGTFGGDVVRNGRATTPVQFSWQSKDGSIDGTMTAKLPDATYQGRFMQVTRQVDSDTLAPMWAGWPNAWSDWPMGGMPGMMDATQFSTVYSGRVIANLKSPGGALLRCRFQMTQPDAGMGGGRTGECQGVGGSVIQATF